MIYKNARCLLRRKLQTMVDWEKKWKKAVLSPRKNLFLYVACEVLLVVVTLGEQDGIRHDQYRELAEVNRNR